MNNQYFFSQEGGENEKSLFELMNQIGGSGQPPGPGTARQASPRRDETGQGRGGGA